MDVRLSNTIKRFLNKTGWNQAKLASKASIDPRMISVMVKGGTYYKVTPEAYERVLEVIKSVCPELI